MSMAAIHESKQLKQLCQRCRDRKARFKYRGVVRADRDHTLCFECYRSERDRGRADQLAAIRSGPPLRAELTDRQRAHRQRMLAHLTGTASGMSSTH